MWEVYEHRQAIKQIDSLPLEVLKRYEKWKEIITFDGSLGLRRIKGFHDEALKGDWSGFRSSRLNIQYRVIYRIEANRLMVKVFWVTPHDYRRK